MIRRHDKLEKTYQEVPRQSWKKRTMTYQEERWKTRTKTCQEQSWKRRTKTIDKLVDNVIGKLRSKLGNGKQQ